VGNPANFFTIQVVGMYRKKHVKLIGLNEYTQQIGSSQLVDKAVRQSINFKHALFAMTESAHYECYSDSTLTAHAVLTFSPINFICFSLYLLLGKGGRNFNRSDYSVI
jgi:hypothetical protein